MKQHEIDDTVNCLGELSHNNSDFHQEEIYGYLGVLVSQITGSVTDWSLSRPKLPLSAIQSWNRAHDVIVNNTPNGQDFWKFASEQLKGELGFGHACWRDDIY